MKDKQFCSDGFAGISTRIEEVVSSRDALGEVAEDVCGVARFCLEFLTRHDASSDDNPSYETMPVFGGFFQVKKLPYHNASLVDISPLSIEEILKESGLLFVSSIQSFAMSSERVEDRHSLSLAAQKLGGHLSQFQAKIIQSIRERIDRLVGEINQIDQLNNKENELQERIDKAKIDHSTALDRIGRLETQSKALSKELEKSKDEEERLKVEFDGLSARRKELDHIRKEVKEFYSTLDAREKELEDLRKKKAELDRKKSEISTRIMDTKEMIEQAEKTIDVNVLKEIKKIWDLLPPDQFDQNRK
jgi:DNA repair exonuclease SbcCD ATPase subunit